MIFTRRLTLLRVLSMIALLVCTLMVVEDVFPERSFCPLAEACAKAHESGLGTIHGVPTSVVGLAAFALFFALTMLPVEWSRQVLRPAGILALFAGLGFIAYQAFALESFCPLCLVVDGAGIAIGLVALTWPAPPVRLSGRFLVGEATSARLAWTFAALLVMVTPFAWPRPTDPSWVEIDTPAHLFASVPEEGEAAPLADLAAGTHPGGRPAPLQAAGPSVRPSAHAPASAPPAPVPPTAAPPPPPPPAPAPDPPPPALAHETSASLVAATPPPPAAAADPTGSGPGPHPPVPTPRPTLYVVEYLNPYCAHCRATHQRFEKVLAATNADVRIRRIYAWGERGYPMWARACAFAGTKGLENRLFAELLNARGQKAKDVYGAAQRAGVDTRAMRVALLSPIAPRRLIQDRALVKQARLQGLPTLDIGRRRLMGEQSEADLQAAIDAALSEAAN